MRKLSKLLLAIIAGIGSLALMLIACRKQDQSVEQPFEQAVPPISNFYTPSPDVDPTIAAIAKSLQYMDVDGRIESKFRIRAGLPVWDKSLVAAKRISTAHRGSTAEEDSAKVILVPFVPEGGR